MFHQQSAKIAIAKQNIFFKFNKTHGQVKNVFRSCNPSMCQAMKNPTHVCVRVGSCICKCMCKHVQTRVGVCVCASIRSRVQGCACVSACVYGRVCKHALACVWACMCKHAWACVWASVCKHALVRAGVYIRAHLRMRGRMSACAGKRASDNFIHKINYIYVF